MKLRTSTLDRIAEAFAQAVACGDYASAEGWVVAARYVADRDADRSPRSSRLLRIVRSPA